MPRSAWHRNLLKAEKDNEMEMLGCEAKRGGWPRAMIGFSFIDFIQLLLSPPSEIIAVGVVRARVGGCYSMHAVHICYYYYFCGVFLRIRQP